MELAEEKTQEHELFWQQVNLLMAGNMFSPQGLISIPAPCQYAHKLTFLVAQSIHKEPSLELANSLFYLWRWEPRASLHEQSEE